MQSTPRRHSSKGARLSPPPSPPRRSHFGQWVRDALIHLHDFPYLQTHPLTKFLQQRPDSSTASSGEALQRHLSQLIHRLGAASDADTAPKVWRRSRLMALRYLDGLDVAAVCGQLVMSKSEYYREHRQSLEAVVSFFLADVWPPDGFLVALDDRTLSAIEMDNLLWQIEEWWPHLTPKERQLVADITRSFLPDTERAKTSTPTPTRPTAAAPEKEEDTSPPPQEPRWPSDVDMADLQQFIAAVEKLTPERRAEMVREVREQQERSTSTRLIVSTTPGSYLVADDAIITTLELVNELPQAQQQQILHAFDIAVVAAHEAMQAQAEQQAS